MSNYSVDPTAVQANMADADKELPGRSSDKDAWIKLDEGAHEFRVIPAADGTWFRKQVSHRMLKHPKGFNCMPTSLGYVFGVASVLSMAIERDKVKRTDGELYEKYGCPLDQLRINLYDQGQDDEAKKYFPKDQYIVNVIHISGPGADPERIKLYSLNEARFTTLRETFAANPAVFNTLGGQNFRITAKGPRTLARRYGAIIFVPASNIVVPEGVTPYDLDEAVAKGIRGFDELVNLVATNNEKFPLVTRLGPELTAYYHRDGGQTQGATPDPVVDSNPVGFGDGNVGYPGPSQSGPGDLGLTDDDIPF